MISQKLGDIGDLSELSPEEQENRNKAKQLNTDQQNNAIKEIQT